MNEQEREGGREGGREKPFHSHSILGLFDRLSEFLQCFFSFLAVLNERQILLLKFSKYVQKLLRVAKKQLRLLRSKQKN